KTSSPDPHNLTSGHLPRSAPAPGKQVGYSMLPDRYRPPSTQWDAIQRDLARRLECPVVSDAYLPIEFMFPMPGGPPSAHPEEHLEDYLDRLCDRAARCWGRAG